MDDTCTDIVYKHKKPLILILNKIDLISQSILDGWVDYFGMSCMILLIDADVMLFNGMDVICWNGDMVM